MAQAVVEAERASSSILAMACGKGVMRAVPCPPVGLPLLPMPLLAFFLVPAFSMLTIKCGKIHKHLIALLTPSSLLILFHTKKLFSHLSALQSVVVPATIPYFVFQKKLDICLKL